jgi:predicted amidophosphoribosyltransferase
VTGSLQTDLDRTYLDPEVRAAAVRVLTRMGDADIVEILGLADVVTRCPTCRQDIDHRPRCPACGLPFPPDGRRACRRAQCAQGPKARGVKR